VTRRRVEQRTSSPGSGARALRGVRWSKRTVAKVVLPTVVAFGVGGAIAGATIPGSDDVIHGC